MSERREEVREFAKNYGIDEAVRNFNLTRETVRRYMRNSSKYDKSVGEDITEKNDILKKISEKFSKKELQNIANGIPLGTEKYISPKIFPTTDVYKMGIMSDTHYGSKHSSPELTSIAFEKFAKASVNGVFISGDITEGLSHRPGHFLECTHAGFENQLKHSVDVLSQWTDTPIYMIDGNHDRWYIKSNGAKIVQHICDALPNAEFMGHDEGDIQIGTVKVKLWHGEDGNSYAFSYRVQKIVESFTGGEKPNILICGHTHKSFYMFDRHIHCISAGAMQSQSQWMRSKRAASHTGFWVVEFGIGKSGVTYIKPEWTPAYI